MKLSFVIPAYNEEHCLGPCLSSILKDASNTHDDFEVIVVNNASTDKTKEVALSFPGVKVVDENRKGLTWARQAGFLASTGDLVANVDSDNRLPSGWTARVLDEFSKNEKLVALSGPLDYYDLPKFMNAQVKLWYFLGYITYLFNHFISKKAGMIQGGNFILRRTALEKIGGFNTGITFYGEDTDIALRMQKTGLIKFTFGLPIYSSGRRITSEGFLTTGFRYAINYFWVLLFKKPLHQKNQSDVRSKKIDLPAIQ